MSDDPEQEAYDDAVIEDTVRCDMCECLLVCGDNDCLVDDGGHVLCPPCAEIGHKLWTRCIRELEACEHGVPNGEWCEPCNQAYKQAATDPTNQRDVSDP